MAADDLLSRIEVNQQVMAGKPIIRGLRIAVEHVLRSLAVGMTVEQILENYPELEVEDIQACMLYAANLMEHEKVYKVA
jgi:uncharacterized protein (DUF433 family)